MTTRTRAILWLILGPLLLSIIVLVTGCAQSPAAQCYSQGFMPGSNAHWQCTEMYREHGES